MMNKYLLIACVALSLVCAVSVRSCTQAQVKFKEATQVIDNNNKAEKDAVKVITKVREIVKNVKEDCDCYNQPLPDDVIKLLRKQ